MKYKSKVFKLLSVLTAVILFMTFNADFNSVFAENIRNNKIIYGDINDDGSIDCFDIVALRKILISQTSLSEDKKEDLNGNNIVDGNDLYLLQLYVLGSINEFPVEVANQINIIDRDIISNKQAELSITKEMQTLAETLKTPVNIYNYLCNNIKTEFYINSRKGAIGTFEMNGGNDVDCASLLIAMLNQIGIKSVYVNGTISLPIETAKNLTGAFNADSALKILKYWDSNAELNKENTQIILKHTWVRSNINGKTYDLDCSFKEYLYQETFFDTLNSKYNFDNINLSESYINDTINEICNSQSGNYAINDKKVVKTSISVLPEALPYTYETANEYNFVDNTNSDTVTFNLKGHKYTYKSAELYGKQISMQYEVNDALTDEDAFLYGASEGETIYDLMKDYSVDGGLKSAGDKYGDMQLVLRINGKKIAAGNPAKITKKQTTTVQINTMGNPIELTKECVVGATYSIVLDYQNMSAYKMIGDIENLQQLKKDLNESNLFSTKYAGKLLEFIGDTYFSELDICCNMLSEQSDVFITRNLGIVFVGYEPSITVEPQNLGYSVDKSGNVAIDAISTTFNTISRNSDSEMENKVQYSIGMVSSQLESSVIDQICDVQSVSSTNIIRYSKLNDINLCMLSSLNDNDITNLSINNNAKEIIKDRLNKGYIITVPEKDITINSWTGSGYIVYNPENSSAEYILSRDTSSNGGCSSNSISLTSMIAIFFSTEALLGSAVFCANALTAISFAGIIPFIGTTLIAAGAIALLLISFDIQAYTFDLVYKAGNGDAEASQQLKLNNYIDIAMASITTSAAIASRVCNSFYKEARVIGKTEKYGSSAVEGAMKNSDDMADAFRDASKLSESSNLKKQHINISVSFGEKGTNNLIKFINSDDNIIAKINQTEYSDEIVSFISKYGDYFTDDIILYCKDSLEFDDIVNFNRFLNENSINNPNDIIRANRLHLVGVTNENIKNVINNGTKSSLYIQKKVLKLTKFKYLANDENILNASRNGYIDITNWRGQLSYDISLEGMNEGEWRAIDKYMRDENKVHRIAESTVLGEKSPDFIVNQELIEYKGMDSKSFDGFKSQADKYADDCVGDKSKHADKLILDCTLNNLHFNSEQINSLKKELAEKYPTLIIEIWE